MDEIIPKTIVKSSPVLDILFYLLIMVIIGMVGIYGYLINVEKNTRVVLANLEQTLAKEKTAEERVLEGDMLILQKRLKDFSVLFANHQSAHVLFELLEGNCHPRVWFSSLKFDFKEFRLGLGCRAANFQATEQQIIIFQNIPDVLEVNLSNLSVRKDGKVDFSLDLTLNPELFKFKSF